LALTHLELDLLKKLGEPAASAPSTLLQYFARFARLGGYLG
jgi:hypothetical protein